MGSYREVGLVGRKVEDGRVRVFVRRFRGVRGVGRGDGVVGGR